MRTSLAPSESPRTFLYEQLQKLNVLLPDLDSPAVTLESLYNHNKPGFYFAYTNDLIPHINDRRKLIAPAPFVFEMLKRLLKAKHDKEFPYSTCPDTVFLRQLVLVVDSENKLELLESVLPQLQKLVFTKNDTEVKHKGGSKLEQRQSIIDHIHNKTLKMNNYTKAYHCKGKAIRSMLRREQKVLESLGAKRTDNDDLLLSLDAVGRSLYGKKVVNRAIHENDESFFPFLELAEKFNAEPKNYPEVAKSLLDNVKAKLTADERMYFNVLISSMIGPMDFDKFMLEYNNLIRPTMVEEPEDSIESPGNQSVASKNSRRENNRPGILQQMARDFGGQVDDRGVTFPQRRDFLSDEVQNTPETNDRSSLPSFPTNQHPQEGTGESNFFNIPEKTSPEPQGTFTNEQQGGPDQFPENADDHMSVETQSVKAQPEQIYVKSPGGMEVQVLRESIYVGSAENPCPKSNSEAQPIAIPDGRQAPNKNRGRSKTQDKKPPKESLIPPANSFLKRSKLKADSAAYLPCRAEDIRDDKKKRGRPSK